MGYSTGPRELHVDKHLTNLAINYRPQGMIADQIAPIVPVMKQRDTYPVYKQSEALSVPDTKRAPGGAAKRVTRSVGSSFYQAENYALAIDNTVEDMANLDDAYRAMSAAGKSRFLIDQLSLDWEKRVLTLVSNTSAVGSLFVTNSAWLTTGGTGGQNAGDPYAAFEQMAEYAKTSTNYRANSVLIGWRAWGRMKRNYHLRNLLKGVNNGGGPVVRQAVADLFEVERFIVADAQWITTNEAQVNESALSMTNALADWMIAYYAPTRPSIDDPSWMYSFRWSAPELPAPLTVFRHPYDSIHHTEIIEAGYYQDERITGAPFALGLLTNVASGAAGLG
jgi:hypothetical protein